MAEGGTDRDGAQPPPTGSPNSYGARPEGPKPEGPRRPQPSPAKPKPPEKMSPAIEEFVLELKETGLKRKNDGVDYEILGALGKGKFACVYKAKLDEELFAVKKIQIFEMGSVKSREKCLKEIKLLQQVTHANIVQYKDSFIDPANDDLVIVLEWAQGGDLKKLIRKVRKANRGFSERQVWKYCAEIAAALQHMHEKRVMHRDLKPANIMLTRDNHIKLGDLGLSRYFTEQTLEAFSKVGTPLYMSPEVLLGKGYGFSADIWSLGCVLYELCMLKSPFKPEKGVNLYALFQSIKSGKFEPIPADSLYSEKLRNFIQNMVVLDFDARPTIDEVVQTATTMFKQLEQQQKNPAPARAQDVGDSGGSGAGGQVQQGAGGVDKEDETQQLQAERVEDKERALLAQEAKRAEEEERRRDRSREQKQREEQKLREEHEQARRVQQQQQQQ
mmetsp:Transcript_17649/g.34456  ORF Transcript_17649/g.34456 Transcript_17649/m.34456 type:complete len:444 (-) Transcript_17649:4641-5972(-)